MRIGGRNLNLEAGESWLSDYARALIMSCFRVRPKPDIVSYLTWKYAVWVYKPLSSQHSAVSWAYFPLSKRAWYEVLHCPLPFQASCSYSPDKAISIIWSFCKIYHVYICVVASRNTTTVNECSEPAQNEGISGSYSFNCLWSFNNWKCLFKLLLAFIKPKSNAAACS